MLRTLEIAEENSLKSPSQGIQGYIKTSFCPLSANQITLD